MLLAQLLPELTTDYNMSAEARVCAHRCDGVDQIGAGLTAVAALAGLDGDDLPGKRSEAQSLRIEKHADIPGHRSFGRDLRAL